MAEELQHLIDRIQKEGIDKAEGEAQQIVSDARQRAADIVKEAESRAEEIIRKAEQDSEIYTERSTRTLEQAARDLLITVGQGVENILSDLVAESVNEALSVEVLEKMLVKIAESCADNEDESRIEFMISEKDQQDLIKFFADRYREKMVHGVEIHTDNEILKGFKVSFSEGRVYQDFTEEAIAEALANFLRPHLAEIVSRVAGSSSESEGGAPS